MELYQFIRPDQNAFSVFLITLPPPPEHGNNKQSNRLIDSKGGYALKALDMMYQSIFFSYVYICTHQHIYLDIYSFIWSFIYLLICLIIRLFINLFWWVL